MLVSVPVIFYKDVWGASVDVSLCGYSTVFDFFYYVCMYKTLLVCYSSVPDCNELLSTVLYVTILVISVAGVLCAWYCGWISNQVRKTK